MLAFYTTFTLGVCLSLVLGLYKNRHSTETVEEDLHPFLIEYSEVVKDNPERFSWEPNKEVINLEGVFDFKDKQTGLHIQFVESCIGYIPFDRSYENCCADLEWLDTHEALLYWTEHAIKPLIAYRVDTTHNT